MILVLAYGAVLLSFASGLLALMMNQRQHVLELSRYWFEKFPSGNECCQSVIADSLEEKQFPVLLRQTVFVLLGLSGVFAVLAGLSVLIGKEVVTDQLSLGLPWLP
ncbi:MAG: hydrogenase 4 subunit B, partial [Methylobacter sp.]|nr:hydrogenase 4 subunit B [Methylobacter sp.]